MNCFTLANLYIINASKYLYDFHICNLYIGSLLTEIAHYLSTICILTDLWTCQKANRRTQLLLSDVCSLLCRTHTKMLLVDEISVYQIFRCFIYRSIFHVHIICTNFRVKSYKFCFCKHIVTFLYLCTHYLLDDYNNIYLLTWMRYKHWHLVLLYKMNKYKILIKRNVYKQKENSINCFVDVYMNFHTYIWFHINSYSRK